MKKPVLILIIVISVLIVFVPQVLALDTKDSQPDQGKKLEYDPLAYDGAAAGEQKLYFFNHEMNETKKNTDSGHASTVSSSDPVISSIAIQNNPYTMVGEISHTFVMRKHGSQSSFSIDMPSTPGDLLMFGAAFLTNLAVHEVGHEIVANHVGVTESSLDFFQTHNGTFFLGTSSVKGIDDNSILPYTMGGEFFADLTFEHALRDYRKKPTMYNQSLLLYSGLDFAFYCFYAFYASEDYQEYDPVTIAKETGISRDHLFSIVVAKTLINAYRVYSGEDRVIPYFTVDRHSAMLNFALPFEIPSCMFGSCGLPEESI